MENLNLGQDVANKRERKMTAAHTVAIFLSPKQTVRYGSLININPYVFFLPSYILEQAERRKSNS